MDKIQKLQQQDTPISPEIQEQSRRLEQLLTGVGATFVGFSDVSGRHKGGFQNLKRAVTAGLHLSDAIIDEITDKPTYTYFHHYRTVNSMLDQIALRGVLFIQQLGYQAVAVPASQTVNNQDDPYSGVFPHKTAAVLAGLGRIGKSGLFIHDIFGPRVRLVTILTDMPLVLKKETNQRKDCGNCNLCVESCPAMALTGKEWAEGVARDELVDAKACSDYMNQKFKHIGRGSVCGICMRVCPVKQVRKNEHIF